MTEIVIKIPDELYKNKKGYLTTMDAHMICDAVAKGTPLPKGHGELRDTNTIVDKLGDTDIYLTDDDWVKVGKAIGSAEILVEADEVTKHDT